MPQIKTAGTPSNEYCHPERSERSIQKCNSLLYGFLATLGMTKKMFSTSEECKNSNDVGATMSFFQPVLVLPNEKRVTNVTGNF